MHVRHYLRKAMHIEGGAQYNIVHDVTIKGGFALGL